ncbi:MAG: serine/threonine-protein kinase [Actinomadura sp.]
MADPLREGDPTHVGPYRLHGRLGVGGMGRVFLGRSRGGYTVAVKMVRPELADDAQFRRRFASEVAAARKVGGFYTAQVVDADPDADPPWLAAAYIPGPSLHKAVTDHGSLPAESVAVLGAGLAEGLAAVHECGLVHRDLKPANVILAEDGPRLIDFGIARALDMTSYTQTATVLGTAAFMSPEQTMAQEVGPPSDVFSLGCVLAFAATGHSPFGEGPGHAVAYRVVHADPDLSGLPDALAGLVTACLAKDPAARPGLEQVLNHLAELASPGADPGEGRWLPPAVTDVITRHKTRVLTLVKTPPEPRAEPTRIDLGKKPVSELGDPLPRSTEKARKLKGMAIGLALLAVVAPAALLYVDNRPFSVWASRWLNGGSSNIDLRDCAVDVGGSLAEVPCWSAAAEYTAILVHHWPSSAEGQPHDPSESCANAEGWDRAVEAPDHMACLERID